MGGVVGMLTPEWDVTSGMECAVDLVSMR